MASWLEELGVRIPNANEMRVERFSREAPAFTIAERVNNIRTSEEEENTVRNETHNVYALVCQETSVKAKSKLG